MFQFAAHPLPNFFAVVHLVNSGLSLSGWLTEDPESAATCPGCLVCYAAFRPQTQAVGPQSLSMRVSARASLEPGPDACD